MSHAVLWPSQVLVKLIVDASESRSHISSVFNIPDDVFQVETM
jgi:hypothetical protein